MPEPISPPDTSHDFDFLVGRWYIKNRRLTKYLQDRTGTMTSAHTSAFFAKLESEYLS